ncbi:MAG: type II secretion system protein GspH, partial [Methylococcaceae bacterium]
GQALISHQETTVILDLAENTYTVSSRDRIYPIPKAIDVTVVTAQSELTEGSAGIRFFVDGSSTGGRITLELGKATWQIDINWLTGQIELNDTEASE